MGSEFSPLTPKRPVSTKVSSKPQRTPCGFKKIFVKKSLELEGNNI